MSATAKLAGVACLAGLLIALSGCQGDVEEGPVLISEDPEPVAPLVYPPEMEEFRATFESSGLRYATATASATMTEVWESKLLGVPWLPVGKTYPLDVDGEPLQLLAQVNFAELQPVADFPDEGILQFFISPVETREQVWGMRLYNERTFNAENFLRALQQQDYFRVIYHADVKRGAEQGVVPQVAMGYLPVNQEAKVRFDHETGYATTSDYRFENVFGADAYEYFEQFGQQSDLVWEQYDDFVDQYSIARVGGYAVFAQEDPRVVSPDDDWVLLLQIDSYTTNDGVEVLWGDVGVGSFHIRREDLLRRDFSAVLYSWDSH